MQKKLIALALATLASSSVLAQSNVTVYGVADVTFDNVNASNQSSGANAFERLNRVSANSSYLGFKGSEALGNGLSAIFQLEGSVGIDSGSSFSFGRDTFVGLQSNDFGKIALGVLSGPTRTLGNRIDVFAGATGIGYAGGILGKLGGQVMGTTDAGGTYVPGVRGRSSSQYSTFDTRWKNAISYTTPTFSGLNATAVYIANENKASGASGIDTSGYDLGLTYKNGPVFAGVTYSALNLKNTATNYASPAVTYVGANEKVNDFRIAGLYDFRVATLRALYERTELKSDAAGTNQKQDVWGLGATYNVSAAGKIVGQFYKANDIKGDAAINDSGARLWAVGYEHSLSKRTILKATYANLKSDNNVPTAYDFGINATGGATKGGTVSGFQIGMRHTF